jgi:hypothetical protein
MRARTNDKITCGYEVPAAIESENVTKLPKGFEQQREVAESTDPSWFYILSDTRRQAQEKLHFADDRDLRMSLQESIGS